MQVTQIRDKYKQILQEPQSQNSDDQWEIAYSQMAKQRKKRILTETTVNKYNIENNDNQQNILNLKQKLAQCLSNCKDHCKQIEKMKKEQMLFDEERIQWQQSTAQLNKIIENYRQNIQANEQKIQNLTNQISNLNSKIQEISLDRQLHLKQSQYYKSQLSQFKQVNEQRQKQYRQFDKEFKQFDKFKRENQYLKNDIERLSFIIQDSLKSGKVSSQIMKRHFLGKPHKELDYWYPQHLVGQVQIFLKKHQIGYGNKDFTSNLVKFIQKTNQKSTKQSQLKIKCITSSSKPKQHSSSIKKPSKIILDNSTYKKHSYNFNSLREQAIIRSTSFWKGAQSRICNDTLLSQNSKQIAIKSVCWEIITEFKSIVFQLLLEKDVKRKKIKKLIDSMCNGVMETFQNYPSQPNFKKIQIADKRDPFSLIKLEAQDITAPLKTFK